MNSSKKFIVKALINIFELTRAIEVDVRILFIVIFCNYSFWTIRDFFVVVICFCIVISFVIALALRQRAKILLFRAISCILFSNYLSRFLDDNNNKEQENCKKQEDYKEENNNRQQRKTFLNICCDKVLNFDSKQVFNCVLETSFLIRDVRQALDVFLEITTFVVLFLQDIISTKCDD